MTERITIEALQAQVQKLEKRNADLEKTMLDLAKAEHERAGHHPSFEYCYSPHCLIARRKIEENHGNK